MSRLRWKAILAGAGALVVSAALVAGVIMWRPAPATTTGAPTPSAVGQGATAAPSPSAEKRGTDETPSAPPKRTRPTKTASSTPTAARRKPTPKPTTSPPKTTTSSPKTTTTTAAARTVNLVSLKLDGLRTEKGCWSSSLFPVATLKGPSGKQVEYGYRWVVDGQDQGWKTDWVTGTTKNQRNPFGAFEPGPHTVVFRLLTPSKASKQVSFTVCEPYS